MQFKSSVGIICLHHPSFSNFQPNRILLKKRVHYQRTRLSPGIPATLSLQIQFVS